MKYFKNLLFLIVILCLVLASCKTPTEDGGDFTVVEIDTVEIYQADLNGENVKKLVDGENPIFIPNSHKLLYRYYDKIMTYDFINYDTSFVATARGADINVYFYMSVSPDGYYVIFPGKIEGAMDLFIATTDGSDVLNISNTKDRWEDNPVFFPDGNSILFIEFIYQNESEHYLKEIATSKIDILGNRYQVIANEGYHFISFSNDGKYIILKYYNSDIGTTICLYNIQDYSIYKEILLENENILEYPKVSEDMYLYFATDNYNIYRINLNTNDREILYSGYIGSGYTFSNNFKKVLIVNNGIKLIDLDSGVENNYFNDWNCTFRNLVFSPDNDKFIFVKSVHKEIFY